MSEFDPPDPHLLAQWREAERLLREAADALGAFDRTCFDDWLVHNEQGLAFDELVHHADQRNAAPTIWRTLAQAAEAMEIGPSDWPHGDSARIVTDHLRRP